MPIAIAIVAAGVIAGAGVVYSANKQSSAASEAANIGAQSAQESLAYQKSEAEIAREALQRAADEGKITIDEAYRAAQAAQTGGFDAARKTIGPKFDEAIALFTPYREAGNVALTDYMSLMKDASALSKNAGYQFEQDQIRKTVENLASRLTGGGPSGDIVNMATQLGRNLASTEVDKYLNRYTPIIGLGESANINVASLLQNQGTILGQLDLGQGTNEANRLISEATAKANLGMTAAGGQASLTASTMPSIALTTQNLGNLQASGIINQANINANMLSNLSNIGSSTANNLLYQDILKNPEKYGYLFGGGGTSTYSGSSTVNSGNLAAAMNQSGGFNLGSLTY